jgi:hypothetical protein
MEPEGIAIASQAGCQLHCKVPFGTYCGVHTDTEITNAMELRTRWGFCLGSTGNMQGSYTFMSLTTGKKFIRQKFTEMPMTESMIKQVKKWTARDQAQSGLTFKDRNGIE